jgi:hypothetical protein
MTEHTILLERRNPVSLEAVTIAEQNEAPTPANERRARSERRGRDRRSQSGRINKVAPRKSLMKLLGAFLTSIMAALFAIVLLAGELFLGGPQFLALAVVGGMTCLAVFTLILGSLEQRLIEIRLELMIQNGGERQGDRRSLDRRGPGGPPPGVADRRS